jgi:predicted ATPase/DNA-binding CsgD family transcriptional regulator
MAQTLNSSTGRLPSEVTSFVGRRKATAELKRALSDSRLVTLTGVGGVGKSRLAVHVAQSLRRAFTDGVWLVEFAEVQRPSLVPQAVAEALGLHDFSARDPETVLVDYLVDRHVLLVFDNCEHVLDACGQLVDRILSTAPKVRVLATSREPLTIRAEQVWPVPPLTVPPIDPSELDGEDHRAALRQNESLALFEDRVAAVRPGFRLDLDHCPVVSKLCQRLDGVPLAIELAAVQMRALSADQILDRLENRFQLLTTGGPDTLPQHQTLRAAVDWSFDFCTEQERAVWARSAVFAGEFDLDAAEAVCSGEGLSTDDVFQGVVGLVDKSILTCEESGASARYRMLETIRQYGLERLAESGRETWTHRRHRDYYLALAERADQESCGSAQARWGERLRAARPNLWAALDYCLTAPGETRTGLRMAGALWFYWIACGFIHDGRDWLGRALAADPEPSRERARALWINGWATLLQGDIARATELLESCRELAVELGDETARGHATQLLGAARMWDNDMDSAGPLMDEALARHRAAGEWTAPALIALPMRAPAALFVGQLDYAIELCDECRRICEQRGEEWVLSWATWIRGVIYWAMGDPDQGYEKVRESLRKKHRISDPLGIMFCIESLGWMTSRDGDPYRAAVLFGASERMWEMIGRPMFGFEVYLAWSDEAKEKIRTELTSAGYEVARGHGARLTEEQVIDYALAPDVRLPASVAVAEPSAPDEALTKREYEVVRLISAGLTNKDIAAELVIARRTAESHVEHILTKLGFNSRTQIAAWFAERSEHQG